jgi:hypothetical protein
MGAWITLFGAIAGRLRPLALASNQGRESAPQLGARTSGAIAARTPGCDARRIGDGRGASELKDVLVESLDLLRVDDPAIEEARLVAGNRDVPGLVNLPTPGRPLRKRWPVSPFAPRSAYGVGDTPDNVADPASPLTN